MQSKRSKRSRNRAARKTAGYGSKKKHRGSGHRGGVGQSSIGKRGSAKAMKVTGGNIKYLGKNGFRSIRKKTDALNLNDLQLRLASYLSEGKIKKEKGAYVIDLSSLGYDKLLSKGTVSEKMLISAESATESAVKKVEAAGGKVEMPGNANSEENK